jgi:hypothetical protein
MLALIEMLRPRRASTRRAALRQAAEQESDLVHQIVFVFLTETADGTGVGAMPVPHM